MSKAKGEQVAEKGLVPRLRFPEFASAQGWQLLRLGMVCNVIQGYGFPTSLQGKEFGKYPFCKVSDVSKAVTENGGLLCKAANYIDQVDLVNLRAKTAPVGATVFAKIGEALRLNRRALVGTECIIDNNVAGIKAKSLGTSDYFVFQLSSLVDLAKHCGGAVPSVSKSTLEAIEVPFPAIEAEQQKIADCLSSLDERIAFETRRRDAIKTHKQGLLQQLFPRENETVPRLRFPEFRDNDCWVKKELGGLGNVFMCKRIFASQTNGTDGVPFFKIGTLGGKPDAFISKKLFEEYKRDYNYPRVGEVLITCSGTVGKCLPYDGRDAYYQDSNIVWIGNPTREISNEMLYIALSCTDWARLNSTTITRIYGADLRRLAITFPAHKKEQQKIADCLTSLDDLIAAQARKIDLLKQHKRGLIQQLFPTLDEAA